MSYYSAKPIHLNLQPSILLATVFGSMSLLLSLVMLMMPISSWLTLSSLLLIMLATAHAIRRYALLASSSSVTHLSLTQAAKLQVTYKDTRQLEVRVLESSFVSPYLTILNLQALETKRRMHVLLLPDSAEPNGFRQLRVWLRWGRDVLNESVSAG